MELYFEEGQVVTEELREKMLRAAGYAVETQRNHLFRSRFALFFSARTHRQNGIQPRSRLPQIQRIFRLYAYSIYKPPENGLFHHASAQHEPIRFGHRADARLFESKQLYQLVQKGIRNVAAELA